jgi:hypothetical protein
MSKYDTTHRRKVLPSAELLRAILRYDKNSGELFWRERPEWTFKEGTPLCVIRSWNAQHPHRPAFITLNKKRYWNGYVNGVPYLAHRVIWKIVFGVEPDFIDHINGDPKDNRLSNLRSVDYQNNYKNVGLSTRNTSQIMGIHWHSTNKRWTANIRVEGRLIHLGSFESKEAAQKARRDAEQLYGYHKNHGRAKNNG